MYHKLAECQVPDCEAKEIHGHNDGGWPVLPKRRYIEEALTKIGYSYHNMSAWTDQGVAGMYQSYFGDGK